MHPVPHSPVGGVAGNLCSLFGVPGLQPRVGPGRATVTDLGVMSGRRRPRPHAAFAAHGRMSRCSGFLARLWNRPEIQPASGRSVRRRGASHCRGRLGRRGTRRARCHPVVAVFERWLTAGPAKFVNISRVPTRILWKKYRSRSEPQPCRLSRETGHAPISPRNRNWKSDDRHPRLRRRQRDAGAAVSATVLSMPEVAPMKDRRFTPKRLVITLRCRVGCHGGRHIGRQRADQQQLV